MPDYQHPASRHLVIRVYQPGKVLEQYPLPLRNGRPFLFPFQREKVTLPLNLPVNIGGADCQGYRI